ncbi:hypothetical protein [Spiroplasma endosymbiont of Stenodema calcarata]|uniref:hypothetical protein n=1 Tax=Spiroplasma endosymbiont of Stenodema calcarata TaxID=3139328 RepID=UPI003CCAEBF2
MSINLFLNMAHSNLSKQVTVILKSSEPGINVDNLYLTLQRKYLISYLVSILFVITFAFYNWFAVKRIKIGYGYCILWFIVWVGTIIAPIIFTKIYDIFFVINCITAGLILLGMFYLM